MVPPPGISNAAGAFAAEMWLCEVGDAIAALEFPGAGTEDEVAVALSMRCTAACVAAISADGDEELGAIVDSALATR